MRMLVLTLLLALGVAGAVRMATGVGGDETRLVPAAGSFWHVRSRSGQVAEVPRPSEALRLRPGDTLVLDDDAATRRIAFRLRRAGEQSSYLDLRLFKAAGRSYRLVLVPGEHVTASLSLQAADGSTRELGRIEETSALSNPDAPFDLAVTLAGPRLTVTLNDQPLISVDDETLRAGSCSLWADGIDVMGLSRDGSETVSDQLEFLRGDDDSALIMGALATALGIILLGGCWLRALVPGQAPLRLLASGTLVLLAGPSAALAASLAYPLEPLIVGAVAALLVLPGLRIALWLLRDCLDPEHAHRGRWRSLGVTLALATWTALALGSASLATVQPVLEEARASLSGLARDTWRSTGTTSLDAANALVAPGPWRSLRLSARLSLPADAVLELRLRSHTSFAGGTALFLSTHALFDSGFYSESAVDFAPVGSSSISVTPDREYELELVADGTALSARLDGALVAEWTDLTTSAGPVYVLAAAGTASVTDIVVAPVRPEPPLPDALAVGWRPACAAVVLLVMLALLASRLTSRGTLASFECMAFALLPLALVATSVLPTGHLDFASFGLAAAASTIIAVMGFVAPGAAPRLPWLALVFATALPPLALAGAFGMPERPNRFNGPKYWNMPAARLAPELVHLQLPLVRRFNTWLKDHRFRDQSFSMEKPAGSVRVLCLGSSSTWGHGIPEATRQDYPTILGELLRERMPRRDVQVINAAVRGSTTARQLRFWREVLLGFQPDIVTASFYFNDSVHLTHFDETAWFDWITQPGEHNGPRQVFRAWRAFEAGGRLHARVFSGFRGGRGNSQQVWSRNVADPALRSSPAQLFEANLRSLAEDCKLHGISLVLVKEPIRGDTARIWRREFSAAMDTVGADFGLLVVNPARALETAGGEANFMDTVHPLPSGNRVIAGVLRPVIERLIWQRQR